MSRSQVRRRRRLFVPIIGAAVLAIGFSAPVASAVQDAGGATIVDGVNDGTVAEGETRADAQQCANYKKWWLADVKPPNRDLAGANYTRKLADGRGCRWAEGRLAVEESLSSRPPPHSQSESAPVRRRPGRRRPGSGWSRLGSSGYPPASDRLAARSSRLPRSRPYGAATARPGPDTRKPPTCGGFRVWSSRGSTPDLLHAMHPTRHDVRCVPRAVVSRPSVCRGNSARDVPWCLPIRHGRVARVLASIWRSPSSRVHGLLAFGRGRPQWLHSHPSTAPAGAPSTRSLRASRQLHPEQRRDADGALGVMPVGHALRRPLRAV